MRGERLPQPSFRPGAARGPCPPGHIRGSEGGLVWAAKGAVAPGPGHAPLHGQGLPQERREDGLLVVVRQQEDALDEGAPRLPVIHHGQLDQDGTQDLGHLGRGGHHRHGLGTHGPLPRPGTPLLQGLLPNWMKGR